MRDHRPVPVLQGFAFVPRRRSSGTRRRRKTAKQEVLASSMYELCITPCPADQFKACFIIWQSAATFRMPVESPEQNEVSVGDKTYVFVDSRFSRGAFAVKDFLRDREDLFPAVVNRILAIPPLISLLVVDPRFAKHFDEDTDNSVTMSEALLEAFAEAQFVPGTFDFDLEAVYARAEDLLDDHTDA
jgi:hypothetical protein